MPSKYQPQILGWIGDLDKGGNYLTGADQRLLYANDNYCAFIRKTKSNQIFYLLISLILIILLIPTMVLLVLLFFVYNTENESEIAILSISSFILCFLQSTLLFLNFTTTCLLAEVAPLFSIVKLVKYMSMKATSSILRYYATL